MVLVLCASKGHYSVDIQVGLKFSAYRLMILYFSTKFHE